MAAPVAAPADVAMVTALEKVCLPETEGPHLSMVTVAPSIDQVVLQVLVSPCTEQIQACSTSLQELYATYAGSYMPQCVGELVAARFSQDQQWYRGEVTQLGNNSAAVSFIDYGNSEEVSATSMSVIDPSLMTYPVFAVHCALHDVSLVPGQQWDESLLNPFTLVNMEIKHQAAGRLEVDLKVPETNQSVIEQLISQGVLKEGRPATPQKTTATPPRASPATPQVAAPQGLPMQVSTTDLTLLFSAKNG